MIKKSVVVAAVFAASLLPVASANAADQDVSLATGFTDFTTWTLAGSASVTNQTSNGYTYSTLHLTQGVGNEAGSAFAPTTLILDYNQPFSFDFHFYIGASSPDWRGDGLTFTLAGAPGLGDGGSGLGYQGLGINSVAFAIDTFHFGPDPDVLGDLGEPVSPSLQILAGGSVTPLKVFETGLGDSIRDTNGLWYARVNYTPNGNNTGTFAGTINHLNLGSFSVSSTVDFDALGMVGSPVYYGFTASNGAATDFQYISSAVPVPEPETYGMLLAGLGLMGFVERRRRKLPA